MEITPQKPFKEVRTWATLVVIAFTLLSAYEARSESVVIGTKVSPSSMDPQLGGLGSDQGYYRHIYDALFQTDQDLVATPSLATDYKIIDDLTWEFHLRRNVHFHDGSEFDANDVLFTFARMGTVPGSDGLQEEKVRPIDRIEVLNPYKIRIHTKSPTPYLLKRLVDFWILPDTLSKEVTTEQLNRGSAIGTGPFRLVEWKRGDQLTLNRNEDYWGDRPAFERVVFKDMTNDATRVAALQSGDVDMIDYVPPLDTFRLNRMSNISVFSRQSVRVVFIQLNTLTAQDAKIRSNTGDPLPKNPLQDRRVRLALKHAITKGLITEKIMEGTASPANQAIPAGYEGYASQISEDTYDLDLSRQLLSDAGFPNGFQLTLSCPNDRYINDAIICQAVGQMWAQIGVRTEIETMPKAVYFSKLLGGEFSAYMLGWGNTRGDSISVLKNVIHSRGGPSGGGTWNASYSNAEVDAEIDRAISLMDPSKRLSALEAIMVSAMNDVAMIPLHTQPVITATRVGLVYTPVPGEETLAILLRPQ